MTALVGILMGSDSDLPVMKDAAEVLDEFQVPYELTVILPPESGEASSGMQRVQWRGG